MNVPFSQQRVFKVLYVYKTIAHSSVVAIRAFLNFIPKLFLSNFSKTLKTHFRLFLPFWWRWKKIITSPLFETMVANMDLFYVG